MRGIERPPWRIRADADDIAGTHTTDYQPLQYIVPVPGVLACRECGAPTTPACGDRCSQCWRLERTERRLERITRMVEAGR